MSSRFTGISYFQFNYFLDDSDCILVPPLAEQRAIAKILGTLDDALSWKGMYRDLQCAGMPQDVREIKRGHYLHVLSGNAMDPVNKIELNRRMNATLEAMARALFRSWFVDFDPVRAKMEGRDTGLPKDIADLFPDRLVDSEFGEIPAGWNVGHVGDGFEIIMGQSPPGHTYNDTGDGLPFFQGRSDFGFRYPKNRKFCTAPNRVAQPWDTMVSVRAPVGDINMAWERCCIGRGVAALRPRSGAVSFGYCAAQALQTHMREYEHTGTVFGAINRNQLARLPLQQPAADIVLAFEHLVHPWDQTIRLRTAEVDTLTALRDVALPKLVSGELRVTGLQPASVRDDCPAPVGKYGASRRRERG